MSQFESHLLVEGVRAVESVSPIQQPHAFKSGEKSFEALLIERATVQDQKLQISALFSHFKKRIKNVYILFATLLFILGGLGVQKMLFTDQFASVNFFWAFALFFIPNVCMFFVWLLLFLKPTIFQNSSLAQLSLALIKYFDRRFNKKLIQRPHYWLLFRCYFDTLFCKRLGKYQLSILTHLLWLSYFSGATLLCVVMLATHQVDFVWQTSILSAQSFQSLTELLAYLPQQLGFTVPTIEQIQQSNIGAINIVDAESRRLAWSSLLISSLLLYGVVPRLILLLFMLKKLKHATLRYSLDLSLPYYVQLRQLLKPNKTTLGITDPDQENTLSGHASNAEGKFYDFDANQSNHQGKLPFAFYPVAIELSNAQFKLATFHLQKVSSDMPDALVNICDHASQQQLLSDLTHNENTFIAVYVALNRVPDRGLTRFFKSLTALNDKQFYLCLLVDNNHNKQRDSDWFQLAANVGIKLDNILYIEIKGSENE